jgi:hypothetical protein
MASGLYNHSKGVSNNVELKLLEYSYIFPTHNGPKMRWEISTSTSDYYFFTNSKNATTISCGDDISGLLHTRGCSLGNIKTCSDNLRDHQDKPCGMMTVIYLTLPTNLVSNYAEVDPVDWNQIIASLGGYWVYVGVVFSIFFAVKKGTYLLIPSKIVKNLILTCFSFEQRSRNNAVVTAQQLKIPSIQL